MKLLAPILSFSLMLLLLCCVQAKSTSDDKNPS